MLSVGHAVPALCAVLDALHEVDVDEEVEWAAEGELEVRVLEAAGRHLSGVEGSGVEWNGGEWSGVEGSGVESGGEW